MTQPGAQRPPHGSPQGRPPYGHPQGPSHAQPTNRPIWKRWWVVTLAVVALIAVLAQLQPDPVPVAAPATATATSVDASTTPATQPTSTTQAPTPEPTCEAVPVGIVERIIGAFKQTPTIHAAQMQAGDPTSFVAVRFSSPGVENEVAVFAVLGMKPDGTGAILAADAFAKQFTTYFDASASSAKISSGDPRIRATRNCL